MFWNAKTAVAALPIVWDDGPNANVSSASIADMLKEGLDASEAFVGNKAGDAAKAKQHYAAAVSLAGNGGPVRPDIADAQAFLAKRN